MVYFDGHGYGYGDEGQTIVKQLKNQLVPVWQKRQSDHDEFFSRFHEQTICPKCHASEAQTSLMMPVWQSSFDMVIPHHIHRYSWFISPNGNASQWTEEQSVDRWTWRAGCLICLFDPTMSDATIIDPLHCKRICESTSQHTSKRANEEPGFKERWIETIATIKPSCWTHQAIIGNPCTNPWPLPPPRLAQGGRPSFVVTRRRGPRHPGQRIQQETPEDLQALEIWGKRWLTGCANRLLVVVDRVLIRGGWFFVWWMMLGHWFLLAYEPVKWLRLVILSHTDHSSWCLMVMTRM